MPIDSYSALNAASNSHTFRMWLDRTNQLGNAAATSIVTLDMAGTGPNDGNLVINGHATANTVFANTIDGPGSNVKLENNLYVNAAITFNTDGYMSFGPEDLRTTIGSNNTHRVLAVSNTGGNIVVTTLKFADIADSIDSTDTPINNDVMVYDSGILKWIYTNSVVLDTVMAGTVNATTLIGNGANISAINPSNITAGTAGINISGNANNSTYLNGQSASFYTNADHMSSGVLPQGRINASLINIGTINTARVSGSYTGITGVGTLTTGSIGSGFGPININSNVFTGNGSGLSAINASNIVGAIATATNATNLNGQPASFYTNANNITTGTLNVSVNTTSNVTAGNVVVSNNLILNNTNIQDQMLFYSIAFGA